MTYDLFHQLLYLSSNQDDSSEFLEKLEHMTATDVAQAYASLQISSRNPFPASGIPHSACIRYCGSFYLPVIFRLFFRYIHAYNKCHTEQQKSVWHLFIIILYINM